MFSLLKRLNRINAMFKPGQDVVCINAEFDNWAIALYENLPEKGKVYTIRDVIDQACEPVGVTERSKGKFPEFVGRKIQAITLEGLINKVHPITRIEKAFASHRFAPLIKEEEEVKEVVSIKPRQPILV